MILFLKSLVKSQELDGKSILLAILIQILEFLLKWDLTVYFLQDLIIMIKLEDMMKEKWNLFGNQIHKALEKMLTYFLMFYGITTVLLEDSACS